MPYSIDDVDAAEQRLRIEVPGCHIQRGDYDWALSVAAPDKSRAYFVFVPERADRGQQEFVADLDKTIAALTG